MTSLQAPEKVTRFASAVFLFFGMVVLVLSRFRGNQTLDIHYHDTYYVIEGLSVYNRLAFLMFVFCGLYFLGSRFLRTRVLAYVHCLFTFCFLLIFLIFFGGQSGLAGMPGRYYDNQGWWASHKIPLTHVMIYAGILLFITGILAFIINYVVGIINYKRSG